MKHFAVSIIKGLAVGLVLFSCDAQSPQRDPESFARAQASREIRKITEAQIVEAAYEQGRAVRDSVTFALPKITAKYELAPFFAYTDSLNSSWPEKVASLLGSYQYQYEEGQAMQDNVQALADSVLVYTFPTDSGVFTLYYPRQEIILAIP